MTDQNRTAIRAALREAAIQAAEIPPMQNRTQAAAAIMAFLRAMPNDCRFLHDLAAQLEAVANATR